MKKLIPLGVVLATLVTGNHAPAASATWSSGPTDGNWVATGSENNWSTGAATFPGAISGTANTDTATFLSSTGTTVAINSSTVNIKSITFGATGTALSSFTIGNVSSGGSLTLTSGGAITFAGDTIPTGITNTINAPLILEGSYTFSNANTSATNVLNIGGTVTNGTSSAITLTLGASGGNNTGLNVVSGNISDGSLGGTTAVSANAGTWALSGMNSFSGGVSINRGTLGINSSHAIGTGTLTLLNSGLFDNTSGSPVTLATNNVVDMNGSETFVGTNSLNLGTGNFVLGAGTSPTITVSSNTLTIGGVISDGVAGEGFAKAGTGTLILSGANTYIGTTSISAGVVNYQNGTAFGTNSAISETATVATIQVQGGITGGSQTLTLEGNGAVGATGALENVSDNNSYSGNIILAADSTISSDSGTLTLQTGVISGAHAITKAGNGTLVLSGLNTYSGSNGSNGTTVSAGTLLVAGSVASGTSTPGALGTGAIFLGDANTTANSSSPALLTDGAFTIAKAISVDNDSTGGTYSIGGATDNVSTFSGLITTNQNLSITQVATTGSDALNITGGIKGATATAKTLTFANVGAVNVTTTALSDGSTGTMAVTQAGSGTTTISTGNTYTGGTTVSGGNLVLNGSTSATGNFTVGGISGGLGTATLSGTGTISGALATSSLNGNTAHIAPGATAGTVGTLHIGALSFTIGAGTQFDYDINTLTTNDDLISMGGGTLTIGGSGIVFNFNQLSTLTTGVAYTLISGANSSIPTFVASDFSATGDSGDTAVFSISGGSLQVTFSAPVGGSSNYYFNGLGADLATAGNFYTTAAGNTAQGSGPGSTSDVFLTSNTGSTVGGSVNSPTLNSALTINSLTLTGTGTPGATGENITGSGTLTIDAGTGTYTSGTGIVVQTGAGNSTIGVAVALGASQSWTVTDSTNTLTVSGPVSGTSDALTKLGAGSLVLSGSNTYSGGTTVSAGTLIANGAGTSSSSSTGIGSLSVAGGATLAGTGTAGTASSGTFSIAGSSTSSRATVLVGQNASAGNIDTNTVSNLTLLGGTGTSTIANANLVFNLNAKVAGGLGGANAGGEGVSNSGNELSVGASKIAFGTGVASVDLTLNLQNQPAVVGAYTPYVLIAGTGSTSTGVGTSTGQYAGLTLGATTNLGGGATETLITGGNLALIFGGTTDAAFYQNNSYLVLYQSSGVDDIDVEVVPEPGTWAMMLGGLAMLIVVQRARRKNV